MYIVLENNIVKFKIANVLRANKYYLKTFYFFMIF